MAIWQYSFQIISKTKYQSLLKEFSESRQFRNIPGLTSWEHEKINEKSLIDLFNILGSNKSWSDDIKLLGKEDETSIEFVYVDNNINEMSCRLDLRTIKSDVFEQILSFIKNIDGLILTAKDEVLEPQYSIIVEDLKYDDSFKFVKNPIDFLNNLSHRIK